MNILLIETLNFKKPFAMQVKSTNISEAIKEAQSILLTKYKSNECRILINNPIVGYKFIELITFKED